MACGLWGVAAGAGLLAVWWRVLGVGGKRVCCASRQARDEAKSIKYAESVHSPAAWQAGTVANAVGPSPPAARPGQANRLLGPRALCSGLYCGCCIMMESWTAARGHTGHASSGAGEGPTRPTQASKPAPHSRCHRLTGIQTRLHLFNFVDRSALLYAGSAPAGRPLASYKCTHAEQSAADPLPRTRATAVRASSVPTQARVSDRAFLYMYCITGSLYEGVGQHATESGLRPLE